MLLEREQKCVELRLVVLERLSHMASVGPWVAFHSMASGVIAGEVSPKLSGTLRIAYGIHLILEKSGLRFSKKAFRPSLASSVI